MNDITIKNKFPIPIIDELLVEIKDRSYNSSQTFVLATTKYDDDISKISFRTHHGLFESVVMSFDLKNAPASFQVIINDVFSDYLRKIILIFLTTFSSLAPIQMIMLTTQLKLMCDKLRHICMYSLDERFVIRFKNNMYVLFR